MTASAPAGSAPADDRRPVRFASTGYFRLHLPEGLAPGPAPALVAFHGYGQPAEEMFAYARSVAPAGTVVVAPEGPSSFYRNPRSLAGAAAGGVGHGWVADPRRADQDARNDALLDAVLEAASRERPLDPTRTVLLGYSQGVGVALHWWASGPDRATAIVAIAGGVNAVNRPLLPRLAGRAALWVAGERDRAYPPEYTLDLLGVLRSAGVALAPVWLPEGHGLLEPARETVTAWLARRLAR